LWGISATGPYLHDGRASTLTEAIQGHGGEAEQSRLAFFDLTLDDQDALLSFLLSLGGHESKTNGLILPSHPDPQVGDLGGPRRPLSDAEAQVWEQGRRLFDHDFGFTQGLGPVFNGDSCRGCHFEPFVGGSGPLGVSAVRFAPFIPDFTSDQVDTWQTQGHSNTLIRRFARPPYPPPHTSSTNEMDQTIHFELRQALPTFGLGILQAISDQAILDNADPEDTNGDGIKGQARVDESGRVYRFGWKAQIASIDDFIGDALNAELGLTIPKSLGISTAKTEDEDQHDDPEMSTDEFKALSLYLYELAPPSPGQLSQHLDHLNYPDFEESHAIGERTQEGEQLFKEIGCALCHIPKLTESQSHSAYTDLLLHDVQADDFIGIKDEMLDPRLFRTPPLWGISATAPYWHDGRASTLEETIYIHEGEATGSQNAFDLLEESAKDTLLHFLRTL
jgi:CxxC motif-containing protein (DUF1111 family)